MGILALGLNLAAFNAEAYRAAIQTIPSAHTDASTALGLNVFKRIIYVILPQALILATPVLITNGIGIFQQSALVALISVEELMYQGRYLFDSDIPANRNPINRRVDLFCGFVSGVATGHIHRKALQAYDGLRGRAVELDFSFLLDYSDVLLKGLLTTLQFVTVAVVFGANMGIHPQSWTNVLDKDYLRYHYRLRRVFPRHTGASAVILGVFLLAAVLRSGTDRFYLCHRGIGVVFGRNHIRKLPRSIKVH